MKDNLNLIILRGVIGHIKQTVVDDHVNIEFSLVTQYLHNDSQGGACIDVTWHPCTIWQKKGSELIDEIKPGSAVEVTGRTRLRKYMREDGSEARMYDVYANSVKVLGSANNVTYLASGKANVISLDEVYKWYDNARQLYESLLLSDIKTILKDRFKLRDYQYLNIRELLTDGSLEHICKFDFSKTACDLCFYRYRIDANGKLDIVSYDIEDDDCDTWHFDENFLDVSDLEAIRNQLRDILSGIESGEYMLSGGNADSSEDMVVESVDQKESDIIV